MYFLYNQLENTWNTNINDTLKLILFDSYVDSNFPSKNYPLSHRRRGRDTPIKTIRKSGASKYPMSEAVQGHYHM